GVEENPLAVARPRDSPVSPGVVGQLPQIASVGAHDVDVFLASLSRDRDRLSVRRDFRRAGQDRAAESRARIVRHLLRSSVDRPPAASAGFQSSGASLVAATTLFASPLRPTL